MYSFARNFSSAFFFSCSTLSAPCNAIKAERWSVGMHQLQGFWINEKNIEIHNDTNTFRATSSKSKGGGDESILEWKIV